MTPLHPDDARSARAWAAFVADDAAATAPRSLEARVMRAAKAAVAQKRHDDAERTRRRWFAGCSAIAASLLAAAAWSLAPSGSQQAGVAERGGAPAAAQPSRTDATPAPTVAAAPAAFADEDPGPPMPMTNVEAVRVLATPPQRLLATRPLFEPEDGAGPVGAPARLRARSFSAPTVEPAFTNGRPAHTIPEPTAPVLAAAPAPVAALPTTPAAAAPEVWSSRSFDGVFDVTKGDKPVPPPVLLDQAMPKPAPREEPPAPPK